MMVSFNVSDESPERVRTIYVKNSTNLKSQSNPNIKMEIKRLSEDNIYLKKQNFKYIGENQRPQDNLNFYKLQLSNKEEELKEFKGKINLGRKP